jgi:hypothetical protein
MDWPSHVFPITGPEGLGKTFGTGFAVQADGEGLLLVTCWHVVEKIGEDRLHVDGRWPCELLSTPGDDALDLAVLRVVDPGAGSGQRVGMPEHARPLRLGAAGDQGLEIITFGYEPTGRRLSGTLSGPTFRPHPSHDMVRAWDYYLQDQGRELDRVKDGYSGAPVYDPRSGSVVAVITHRQGSDKGFAVDIANLPRVYPAAAAWLAGPDAGGEDDHDYLTDTAALRAKRLDHQEQRRAVRELLSSSSGGVQIALVECCAEDWYQDLADHLQSDHHPTADDSALHHPAIELNLGPIAGRGALWDALLRATPGAPGLPDLDARRRSVRAFLIDRGTSILCAPVKVKLHGGGLAEVIRGARTDFDELGGLGEARVLLLVAAVRSRAARPWWRRWLMRIHLKRLSGFHSLPEMRELDSADLDAWYAEFPGELRSEYDRDRLKAELLRLFNDRPGVRHHQARCLLVGCEGGPGAVERARRRRPGARPRAAYSET